MVKHLKLKTKKGEKKTQMTTCWSEGLLLEYEI